MAGQQIGQRSGVQMLDICDNGVGAGGTDVVGVIGIADDRGHLVAVGGENAGQMQSDLAVAADDDDARHIFQSTESKATDR